MFRFEKIEVWQKALAWTQRVYEVSQSFPAKERFGLTAQLRRAAVSVPSNIAEGADRETSAEFVRFLEIAYGSLMEAVCHCGIAANPGYLSSADQESLRSGAEEIARMLSGLRSYRQTGQW